ncbi:MAG: hypothetical protein ACRDQA_10075 [Nocardioidaceae bacterium]
MSSRLPSVSLCVLHHVDAGRARLTGTVSFIERAACTKGSVNS